MDLIPFLLKLFMQHFLYVKTVGVTGVAVGTSGALLGADLLRDLQLLGLQT